MSNKFIRKKKDTELAKQLTLYMKRKLDNIDHPDTVISSLINKYNKNDMSLNDILNEAIFHGMVIGLSMNNSKVKKH